jgi:glycosyltransferase involved in cell wall biosynthesis
MPAYNARQTVRRAVTSTLKAMSPNDELLLIDDGSYDGTLDEVSQIRDPRLRSISNTSNIGLPATLNKGLGISKNKLIARMDADDIALPWRFRQQRKIMAKAGADFVFSNCIFLFSDNLPFVMPNVLTKADTRQLAKLMTQTNPFIHPTAFFRKQAVASLGGYRDVPNEDFDLWQRALMAGYSMWRTGSPTIIFRIHRGQLTQSADWANLMSVSGTRVDNSGLQKISGDVRLNFVMTMLEIPSLRPGRKR